MCWVLFPYENPASPPPAGLSALLPARRASAAARHRMGDPELARVTTVQLATTDNAFKPVELPLPLTHAGLLDAARKKFKAASKQSRLFDATSGAEIVSTDAVVQLATGANVMVSGKAGWKGAERLRAEWAATERAAAAAAAAAAEARAAADAAAVSAAVVPVAAGDTAARAHLGRAFAEHEATRAPGTRVESQVESQVEAPPRRCSYSS